MPSRVPSRMSLLYPRATLNHSPQFRPFPAQALLRDLCASSLCALCVNPASLFTPPLELSNFPPSYTERLARSSTFVAKRNGARRLIPSSNFPMPLFIQFLAPAFRTAFSVQPSPLSLLGLALLASAICLRPPSAQAREPKPEATAAFNLYRDKTQARMDADRLAGRFLYIDRFPDSRRQEIDVQLRRGQFYLEQLHTLESDHKIPVLDGIIHHWIGIAFLPGATLQQIKSVLVDYDHQKDNYWPDVRQSKLVWQNGNKSEVLLQFYSKTIVTAVFNVNFASETSDFSPARTQIRSCSTRVREVENFALPDEHELPPENAHGYMWMMCTWWHIEEKDGGTYIQVEAIELSRSVPFAFAWIVNPIIRNVPRTFLSHLLSATQKAVAKKTAQASLSNSGLINSELMKMKDRILRQSKTESSGTAMQAKKW